MDVDQQMIKEFMVAVTRQIALLDVDTMREIVQDAEASQRQFEAIGHIVDPTAYRDMLSKRGFDHLNAQTEIVKHMIAIHELAHQMDAITRKNQGQHHG